MVIAFLVKNMVILGSESSNYLYVKEVAGSFTKIGAPYLATSLYSPRSWHICQHDIIRSDRSKTRQNLGKRSHNQVLTMPATIKMSILYYNRKAIFQGH